MNRSILVPLAAVVMALSGCGNADSEYSEEEYSEEEYADETPTALDGERAG